MRLVNFGPGEIADRLTILALKIQYGKERSKSVDHFEKERNALLPQLPSNPRLTEYLLELGAVNSGIWHGEDALRELRREWVEYLRAPPTGSTAAHQQTVEIAFRLQELNDRRHELVSLINLNLGNNAGPEKL